MDPPDSSTPCRIESALCTRRKAEACAATRPSRPSHKGATIKYTNSTDCSEARVGILSNFDARFHANPI